MGTGWRRALCSTLPKDHPGSTASPPPLSVPSDQEHEPLRSPSLTNCAKIGFFSNPSTPRLRSQHQRQRRPPPQKPVSSPTLRCRTVAEAARAADTADESSSLQCKNKTKASLSSQSAPSSPRSPLKLSLFKNSFKFRSSCGICSRGLKAGQGTAIYTAECGHGFHFLCIFSHARKEQASLLCPVCSTAWKDIPLLAIRKTVRQRHEVVLKTEVEDKKMIESSPRTPKLSGSRNYDDDEPLSTPRFVPIPEAEEERENEDEEFQGFFVKPNESSSLKFWDKSSNKTKRSTMRQVETTLLPEHAFISAAKSHETHVVALRLKAPPPPETDRAVPFGASRRAPIDLVTVLDLSGSMSGAKLQMLKRAMRLVISSLGSADRLSIVVFAACSKRLLPLRRMTAQGQRAARGIVDRLACSQGTCAADALRKAAKVLEERRDRNPVASIILLSDGPDEKVHSADVNQRQERSHVSSTRFAHVEIPVHAFGLSEERGYGLKPTADDAFSKCLGGLLSVVVQDLTIQLGFAAGSAPAEIAAVYSCNRRPALLGSGSLRLGNLYAEEERELLVELRVPRSVVGANHMITVRCCYRDPAGKEVVYGGDQALLVPRLGAVGQEEPKIRRLRKLFVATRAIAESRRLVGHEEYNGAHQLLASAQALIMHCGVEPEDEYVRALDNELAEVYWGQQRQSERQRMIRQQRGNDQRAATATAAAAMVLVDENGETLTPTSAWRAAEKLAKLAAMKKSQGRVRDLHGFENARF